MIYLGLRQYFMYLWRYADNASCVYCIDEIVVKDIISVIIARIRYARIHSTAFVAFDIHIC